MQPALRIHRFCLRLLSFGITLATITSSCTTVRQLGRTPAPEPPFVELKDGTIIHPKEAGQEMGFHNSMVLADDQAFLPNKVARYSDGQHAFVNLRKGTFGPRIADGKIIVYSPSDAAILGYPGHDYHRLYIQDSGTAELYYLKYRALKPMIPANTVAAQRLAVFRRNRTAYRLTMMAGAACFIGGTFVAGNAVAKDKSDAVTHRGLGLIFGGMGVMFGTSIALHSNKMNLRHAIAVHNGIFPPK